MTTIDFTRLMVQTSFEGDREPINVAKIVGNLMMYNGSILLDIGFEELARSIYYSTKEVDIPAEYKNAIIRVVTESQLPATVKREIRTLLTTNER